MYEGKDVEKGPWGRECLQMYKSEERRCPIGTGESPLTRYINKDRVSTPVRVGKRVGRGSGGLPKTLDLHGSSGDRPSLGGSTDSVRTGSSFYIVRVLS